MAGEDHYEADDHLFCLLTLNHRPLHINDVYASQSQQGRNVVVGPLVYSIMLGMSVANVSGNTRSGLKREGVTSVKTNAYKQDGTLVATFARAVLAPRRSPGE